MSDWSDSEDEMSRRLFTDRDVDAVLSIVGADRELDPLARFVDDVRQVAKIDSVRPTPALMALFESDISPHIVPNPAEAGLAVRRTSMRRIPKAVAGLSLTAKLLLAGGVASVAAAGGAATGSLPDAAQNAAATLVRTVSPFEIPSNDHSEDKPPVVVPGSVEVTPPIGQPDDVEAPEIVTGSNAQPDDVGQPESPGKTGLDTANGTPAEGHVPGEVPAMTAPATTPPGIVPPSVVPPVSTPTPSTGPPASTPTPSSVPPVHTPTPSTGPPVSTPTTPDVTRPSTPAP